MEDKNNTPCFVHEEDVTRLERVVPYFFHEEVVARLERIIKRMVILCGIMAVTLILTNLGFFLHWMNWI